MGLIKSLITVFFIFLVQIYFGQKPFVELSVSSSDLEVGKSFNVTAKSNIGGNIDIVFPKELKPGYSVLNGMKQEMDYTAGKFVSLFYITKDAEFKKAGTFKIGPAVVRKGGKVYRSDLVEVRVTNNTSKNQPVKNKENLSSSESVSTKSPAFGLIDLSKRKLYEGEPLIIQSSVYSRFRPSQLENYVSYKVPDVMDVHDIDKSSQVNLEQKEYNGEYLYYFGLDKKVVFPIKKGKHKISPFEIDLRTGFGFRGYDFKSNAPTYEVVPLPVNAPSSFKGGVGEFSLTRSVSNKEFTQGDVITLKIEIKGEGNLHLLSKPELELPSSIQIYGDPIVKEKIAFNSNGADGKVTYSFSIQLLDSGNLVIPKMNYSYFNSKKEKYVSIDLPEIQLNVKGDSSFALMSDLYAKDTLGYEIVDETEDVDNKSINIETSDSSSFHWMYLTIIGFLVLILFIFIRKKPNKEGMIENSQTFQTSSIIDEELDTVDSIKQDQLNRIKDNIQQLELYLIQNNYVDYYSLLYKLLNDIIIYNYVESNNTSTLSRKEMIDYFNTNTENLIQKENLSMLLNKCEEAKYALSPGVQELKLVHEKAEDLFNRFNLT